MYEALHYNIAGETTRDTTGPIPTMDVDVVELARDGDGQAFAQLFQTYNGQICTYLSRLVGNDDIGRDLAQETFIRAWKHLPGMQGDVQFKPWLYRIAPPLRRCLGFPPVYNSLQEYTPALISRLPRVYNRNRKLYPRHLPLYTYPLDLHGLAHDWRWLPQSWSRHCSPAACSWYSM